MLPGRPPQGTQEERAAIPIDEPTLAASFSTYDDSQRYLPSSDVGEQKVIEFEWFLQFAEKSVSDSNQSSLLIWRF